MSAKKRLVFAGAGHAHLYALSRAADFVKRGIEVVLIAPGPFWYSGMGPGLLSGRYRPEEDSVDVAALVKRQGGRSMTDVVRRVDAAERVVVLESGEQVSYDALSLNVGSHVPVLGIEGATEYGVPVKPVKHFLELRDRLTRWPASPEPLRVVVVGGGAAGCEAAANALRLSVTLKRTMAVTLVSGSGSLLSNHVPSAGRFMLKWFAQRGVDVLVGTRVERIEEHGIVLNTGLPCPADVVVMATGVQPSHIMRESGLVVAPDGALLVDDHLQSVAGNGIFGGGDCISLRDRSLARVGVYAVREGPVLHHNLQAYLLSEPMRSFEPQEDYLLILNLGDGTGLFMWRGRVRHGRWAFWFKEWLDRRFIRTFQRA